MADQLPAPPVPADADLRDFPFMPLDVLRLRDSDLATIATGEEFKAAVLLWCAAWHQVPAASLPKDDRWLARHSGAGSSWKKVKEEALRGFIEHSDGRLYHGVVVEKALEALRRKGEQRVRTLKARIAALEKRLSQAPSADDKTHLQGIIDDLRQQLPQPAAPPPTEPVANSVTGSNRQGQGDRQGEGQGQGDSRGGVDSAGAPPPPPDDDPIPLALDRRPEAEALRLWNETAERIGLPIAQRLTDPRRKALKIRLSESGGIDGWRAALAKVEASSFLTGRTGRTNGHENWRCDLDFILRQAKFTKLMEGGFDDPPSQDQGPAHGRAPTRSDGIAAAFARRSVPV